MTTTRETEKQVESGGEFMVVQWQEDREKKKKIQDLLMNEHKDKAPFPSGAYFIKLQIHNFTIVDRSTIVEKIGFIKLNPQLWIELQL